MYHHTINYINWGLHKLSDLSYNIKAFVRYGYKKRILKLKI